MTTDGDTDIRSTVLSARQRQALALRDVRLLGLVELLQALAPLIGKLREWLGGIDLGQAGALFEAIGVVFGPVPPNEPELRFRVVAVLKAARVFVAITPGDRDDAFLDAIDRVLASESVLDALLDLVGKFLPKPEEAWTFRPSAFGEQLAGLSSADETAAVQALAIDWGTIQAIVTLIVQVWSLLPRKKITD